MRGMDPAALDRHITGNYGEDQFRDVDDHYENCPRCHRKRPNDRAPGVEDCWCTQKMLDEYGTIREPEGE